jgi:hypothetical protein
VRVPILFDDFDLYRHAGRVTYEEWEQKALFAIEQHDFVAFSLHDCYAGYWLPHYDGFLRKIRGLGTQKTLDEVAGEMILASGR